MQSVFGDCSTTTRLVFRHSADLALVLALVIVDVVVVVDVVESGLRFVS